MLSVELAIKIAILCDSVARSLRLCWPSDQTRRGRRLCESRPPRWPASKWCAAGYGFGQEEGLLQRCCRGSGELCFHTADSINGKCCRTDLDQSGFFGFVLPPFSFKTLGVQNASSNQTSLWMSDHIRIVSYTNALRELEQERVVQNGMFHTSKAGFVADLLPVRGLMVQYRRLYSPHAETYPQAVWEYMYYNARTDDFVAELRKRASLRYGKHVCDQFEAGSGGILSDQDVLKWIATRWIARGNPPLRSYVNFGAGDGLNDDPLHFAFNDHSFDFGLAIEGNPHLCASHLENLPVAHLVCQKVSVSDISIVVERIPNRLRTYEWKGLSMFERREYGRRSNLGMVVPEPLLDIVKVDLDSTDCDIIHSFLHRVPAKIVLAEVNDGFPPPIQMAVHEGMLHDNDTAVERQFFGGAWGCSLSYQVHLLASYGYQLVWYASPNALYVHQSVASKLGLPGPLDEVDCYAKSLINTIWPDVRTLRRWFYEVPLDIVLQEARSALAAKYSRFQGRIPFTLRV